VRERDSLELNLPSGHWSDYFISPRAASTSALCGFGFTFV
jgi:hypothetical protein